MKRQKKTRIRMILIEVIAANYCNIDERVYHIIRIFRPPLAFLSLFPLLRRKYRAVIMNYGAHLS
jgi:hypothetical protein